MKTATATPVNISAMRNLLAALQKRYNGSHANLGFTLVEVLVSFGIFGVLAALAFTSLIQNTQESFKNTKRYEAMQAAQTVLDNLRFEDMTTLTSTRTQQVTVGGRSYDVTTTFCEISQYCLSEDSRHITVRVKYKTSQIYATDTVFSNFK